ncbi:MAG: hypothetical protein KAI53_03875 [Candidatus Aenigmarchaeota archaeon]|nr:hypothetical protein [Candidatus Aenigmarchaeota archaeon]
MVNKKIEVTKNNILKKFYNRWYEGWTRCHIIKHYLILWSTLSRVLMLFTTVVGYWSYVHYSIALATVMLLCSFALLLVEFKNSNKKVIEKPFCREEQCVSKTNNCFLKEIKLNKEYKDSGYKIIGFGNRFSIYSKYINRNLSSDKKYRYNLDIVSFKAPKESLKCLPSILSYRAKKKRSILYNNKKIRLCADMFKTPTNELNLQFTDYFSGECTNDASCNYYKHPNKIKNIFSGHDLFIEKNKGDSFLLNLSDSNNHCANRIGAQTLALTTDGYIIILHQSGRAAYSKNKLVPSGSGSADKKDLKGTKGDLKKFIINIMERELIQECGLKKTENPIKKTKIIGFSRTLQRGGKPEFFGFSKLNVDSNVINPPNDERIFFKEKEKNVSRISISEFAHHMNNGIPKNIWAFAEKIISNALEKENKKEKEMASTALLLNLIFLIEYLNDKCVQIKKY